MEVSRDSQLEVRGDIVAVDELGEVQQERVEERDPSLLLVMVARSDQLDPHIPRGTDSGTKSVRQDL